MVRKKDKLDFDYLKNDRVLYCLREKVLEKLAVIVKNIKLSMAVDCGALATVEQRDIFGGYTMGLDQYAICARVCAQCPDEDICGDMPTPYDQESESLTMKLLVSVIDVYTPLLVQDIKTTMKSNKKAAED